MGCKDWILIAISPIITCWILSFTCDLLLKVIRLLDPVFHPVEGNLKFMAVFTLFTGIYLALVVRVVKQYGFLIGMNLLMYVLMLFYLLNKPKGTIGLVPKGAIKEFGIVMRHLGTGIYKKYLKKKEQ